MAYSAFSVYNYVAFGNCNGPDSSAFCVFDAVLGANADASYFDHFVGEDGKGLEVNSTTKITKKKTKRKKH